MSDDLRKRLDGAFTEEERFNIERAMEYFENEYSQLEDRVRSGIVATSTAFINQFQEFAANRVLCPKERASRFISMEQLIREGKILLFDINPARPCAINQNIHQASLPASRIEYAERIERAEQALHNSAYY